jgi:FlaG/FlaF family flagellin (archaellin)
LVPRTNYSFRVLTRLVTLLLIALAATACSGGGSSASGPTSSGPTVPSASTLPPSGTVKLADGIIYTVAAPGTNLSLDNLTLRILGVAWRKHVSVAVEPPGTSIFAQFTVRITNDTTETATVGATQIWLRNPLNHTFLAAATAVVPKQLIGASLAPGQATTGTLVFPLPGRQQGGLLVYRFGDTPASAKHVGIARFS